MFNLDVSWNTGYRRQHRGKQGRRGGLLVRLRRHPTQPPIPSILLANMQSISNKLDELHCRINTQQDMRSCCVFCFSETWLTLDTPDSAIQPERFSVHRLDRSYEATGKAKGGGVCFLVNNSWCTEVEVISHSYSPALERLTIKCRPFYSPREFPSVLLTAVYIPPQAKCYGGYGGAPWRYQHLQAISIIAGDFIHCSLRSVLPKYHQHVSCHTRGEKTLDHCYSNIKGAFRSIPRPPFGKSHHSSVLLLPVYRQEAKRETPNLRTVQCWSADDELKLQGCFELTDWSVFRDPNNLCEYADTVTDYVKFCVDSCIPTRTIRSYTNQKPWINSDVRTRLKERSAAYKAGDKERYKEARYELRKAIKSDKKQHRDKLEQQCK